MSITKSSTFTDPLLPFQLTNVLNDKGNQSQKFFGHLAHFVFFEGGCEFVLSEEYVTQLSQSNENASFTSLHTSHICYAVEYLASQARCHNQS